MVRLADLPGWEREHMLDKVKDLQGFDSDHANFSGARAYRRD